MALEAERAFQGMSYKESWVAEASSSVKARGADGGWCLTTHVDGSLSAMTFCMACCVSTGPCLCLLDAAGVFWPFVLSGLPGKSS